MRDDVVILLFVTFLTSKLRFGVEEECNAKAMLGVKFRKMT